MRFPAFRGKSQGSIAQRLIDQHARWLTRALQGGRAYPRIPTRKVAEGGFARLLATRQGRRHADQWWLKAFERLD